MQDAIRRYSAEVRRGHGIEVQIRVGLHSGEVVVRAIDNDLHMDYSAIGQTTHLAARIDRLPPEEKALLQTAAVIGTEVPLPLLQAVAEAPEAALRLGLTHLQAAEALVAALDDPGRLGRVLRSRASAAYFTGAYDQTIAASERVLALATAGGGCGPAGADALLARPRLSGPGRTILGRWPTTGRPWRPSRGLGAMSATEP